MLRRVKLWSILGCLRQPGQIRKHYKVYERELLATYQILWHPDCSCWRDKVNRAAGRRAGALFFARHLDYFIVTGQLLPIYRDPAIWTTSSWHENSRPSTRTMQKLMPTLTRTATQLNRRAVRFHSWETEPYLKDFVFWFKLSYTASILWLKPLDTYYLPFAVYHSYQFLLSPYWVFLLSILLE